MVHEKKKTIIIKYKNNKLFYPLCVYRKTRFSDHSIVSIFYIL